HGSDWSLIRHSHGRPDPWFHVPEDGRRISKGKPARFRHVHRSAAIAKPLMRAKSPAYCDRVRRPTSVQTENEWIANAHGIGLAGALRYGRGPRGTCACVAKWSVVRCEAVRAFPTRIDMITPWEIG